MGNFKKILEARDGLTIEVDNAVLKIIQSYSYDGSSACVSLLKHEALIAAKWIAEAAAQMPDEGEG